MLRHIDAIFSNGAFRPLEPLAMPEGTCVHLSVEEETKSRSAPAVAKLRTPRLANRSDAADFVLHIQKSDDAPL